METQTIALGISVLVIFVLLMNCSGVKSGMRSAPQDSKPTDVVDRLSDYGTGVNNRNMKQRQKDTLELDSYDDYNAVAQYTALEPEIFESHNEYTKDINRSTSGASIGAVRSDDMNFVPWIGLRRPQYQDVYTEAGARQEVSVYQDQMPDRPAAGSYGSMFAM